MIHGKTVKYCWSCKAPKSHLIVEQGSLKGYICERYETHGAINQRSEKDLPGVPPTHTGNCRHLHYDRLPPQFQGGAMNANN